MAREDAVNATSLRYLNRLSDLLFVLARHLNRIEGVTDVLWKRGRGS
jgi:cob(I)alamin adenosyltransferase